MEHRKEMLYLNHKGQDILFWKQSGMNNAVLLTLFIVFTVLRGNKLALVGRLQTQSSITLKYLHYAILFGVVLKHGHFTLQYENWIVDEEITSVS
jgi:hypothetical protein